MKLNNLKKLVLSAAVGLVGFTGMFGTAEAVNKLGFTDEELAYMPAVKQIELFKKGDLAPIDVLEAQIRRVEKYNGPIKPEGEVLEDYLGFNGKVNALSFEKFADARNAAKNSEARYKNGTARAMEGITVGVKNENQVAGWRVDSGTILMKDAPLCEEDCAIIENLKNAGAVLVFSTNVPEFYISSMTWSKLYGVTRNPWNLYYGTGGSSGGSGAALAAGFCTVATGSDMGGSIRIPSSMCGVYGIKSPFGRVPTTGICYETLGPMAKNFDDLVLMQNVLAGPSPKVHSSLRPKLNYPKKYESLKGTKVAVCYFNDWISDGLDKDTVAIMDNTVEILRKAGAQVDVVTAPGWTTENGNLEIFMLGLMSTEMYELIDATEGADPELLTPYARKMYSATKNKNCDSPFLLALPDRL